MAIRPGYYRHFKGKVYAVLGVGRDTETDKLSVVYRDPEADPENSTLWVRDLEMFCEMVKGPTGEMVRRFEPLDP